MDIEEHKILNKVIQTIKDYFEFDNEMQAYYLYFNSIRVKLCPIKPYNEIKNVTDIFVQYNNLYFSVIDGSVHELWNSQQKNGQKLDNNYKYNYNGTLWYDNYTKYLHNCRCLKQEELVQELLLNVKNLQQEVDLLKQEIDLLKQKKEMSQ